MTEALLPANYASVLDKALFQSHGPQRYNILWSLNHLSSVACVQLESGPRLVAKLRAFSQRLRGAATVHRRVWEAGFPCPRPIGTMYNIDGVAVSFEVEFDDGIALDVAAPDSTASAEAFVSLISTTERMPDLSADLAPAPPWLAWGEDRPEVWPWPDDIDVDLNDVKGAPLLDSLAVRIRERLLIEQGQGCPIVIGHGDWEAQNVFWRSGRLHVVHDWDSVVAMPESTLAGAAAGVHAVRSRPPGRPSPADIFTFLSAYETYRGRQWSSIERRSALAAALWVHAFNAKKAFAARGCDPRNDEYLVDLIARLSREIF